IAAAVVVLGAVFVWSRDRAVAPALARPLVAEAPEPGRRVGERPPSALESGNAPRASIAAEALADDSESTRAALLRIEGRVCELDGRRVPGVRVVFEQQRGDEFVRAVDAPSVLAGADATF